MIGRTLNGVYRVSELVGGGGFADVYLGRDLGAKTVVAIKVLHANLTLQPDIVERFVAEAGAAKILANPHVVKVLDSGQDAGTHFIIMEYVSGHTLAELVGSRGQLPVAEAVGYTKQLLVALSAAHKAGIIHRDIKPHNVMVTPDGQVKVMDFGIAKFTTDPTRSQTGVSFGTASYVSPEQARGEKVSYRSDLYSAATVLFEMLAGRPPFVAQLPWQVLQMHVEVEAPLVSVFRPDTPPGVVNAIARGLMKSPDRRFQSADEMLSELGYWDDATQRLETGRRSPQASVGESSQSPDSTQRAIETPSTGRRFLETPSPSVELTQPGLPSGSQGQAVVQGGAVRSRPHWRLRALFLGAGAGVVVLLVAVLLWDALLRGATDQVTPDTTVGRDGAATSPQALSSTATTEASARVTAATTVAKSPTTTAVAQAAPVAATPTLLAEVRTTATSVPSDFGAGKTVPAATPFKSVAPSALQSAVERVKTEGYTVGDTSTYSENQLLRVLIGTATGSADGYKKYAFFFARDKYLGPDTFYPSAGVSLAWQTNDTLALSYALYRPGDPLCCPAGGSAVVRFRWDGSRIVPLDIIPSEDWKAPLSRR